MKKILKSELLNFAKSITPKEIKIRLIEHDSSLSLHLKWKGYSWRYASSYLIWLHFSESELDQRVYDSTMEKLKDKIKRVVMEFGKDQCDFLIDRFGLSDVYKEIHEDKNIMYKVKHNFNRRIDDAHWVTRNLSFYYYDEIKVSLPNLYFFWILLLEHKFNHKNFQEIFDITYSIIERVKQLFFTYSMIEDIIRQAKHFGNPDTFFAFFYHFSYLVSLVKTIGDNLAWILNSYCNLNVRYFHIDVNSNKFKSRLSRLHYDDLYSNNYFSEYEKLSSFRDIIQHRHIIRAMRIVTGWDRKNRILIPKNPETLISNALKLEKNTSTHQYVKLYDDVDSVIRNGLHEYFFLSKAEDLNDYEDPLEFSKKHINGICLMINRIFSRLANEATRILIGEVTHFYAKGGFAAINLSNELKVGDQILIEGRNTSLQQETLSMEIEHRKVERCERGLVAIKVGVRVRTGDKIYKIRKIDGSTFSHLIS